MEIIIFIILSVLIVGAVLMLPIGLIVLISCLCSNATKHDYKYFAKIFNVNTVNKVAPMWSENKSKIYRNYLEDGFRKNQLTEEEYREFLHYFYLLDNHKSNEENIRKDRIKEFENALRNI